jgi:hypothetical protein
MGEPQVDLFDSQYNRKLRMYCSLRKDKAVMAQDALSIPWKNLSSYAFPPFALITRVIRKVSYEKATLTLIAPVWPQRSWYTYLLGMCIQCPILLQNMKDILTPAGLNHHIPEMLWLAAWNISGRDSETEAFQKRLCTLYSKQDLQEQGRSIVPSGEPSPAGVLNGIRIPFVLI